MKIEDFSKLQSYAQKEICFSEDNLMEKSIQLSNLYVHFLQLYSKEVGILKSKIHHKDKIYGELYHWYKFHTKNSKGETFEYQLESAKEIDSYIKSNDIYYQLALECSQQEVQVNFIEQTLTNINNLGFRIKNTIDVIKIKKGLL